MERCNDKKDDKTKKGRQNNRQNGEMTELQIERQSNETIDVNDRQNN